MKKFNIENLRVAVYCRLSKEPEEEQDELKVISSHINDRLREIYNISYESSCKKMFDIKNYGKYKGYL